MKTTISLATPFKTTLVRAWLLSSLALAQGAAAQATTESPRPDFTGVYRTYRAPGEAPAPALPLTEEGRASVDEVNRVLEGTGETAGGWCLGYGMPASMLGSGGYPMEIIQRPEQVTVIYEAYGEIRRIYVGEDNQTPVSDRFPDRNGYSRGWWEGDTLVVETTQIKEQADGRYPHSGELNVQERYSAQEGPEGERLLVAEVTLNDPLYYSEPVELRKTWRLDSEARMLPYDCNEPAWLERLDELRESKLNASG